MREALVLFAFVIGCSAEDEEPTDTLADTDVPADTDEPEDTDGSELPTDR